MTLRLRLPGMMEGIPSLSSNQVSIPRAIIPPATMMNHRKLELILTSTSHMIVKKGKRQVSSTRFRYCAEMTPRDPQSRLTATSDVYENCDCITRNPCCKGKIILTITSCLSSLLVLIKAVLAIGLRCNCPFLTVSRTECILNPHLGQG